MKRLVPACVSPSINLPPNHTCRPITGPPPSPLRHPLHAICSSDHTGACSHTHTHALTDGGGNSITRVLLKRDEQQLQRIDRIYAHTRMPAGSAVCVRLWKLKYVETQSSGSSSLILRTVLFAPLVRFARRGRSHQGDKHHSDKLTFSMARRCF